MDQLLYSTGRYGLVDIFYRKIWINTWCESVAHELRRVFRNHVCTIVIDLSRYENYKDDVVDSEVCLDWRIPRIPDSDPILSIYVKNHEHDRTIEHLSGTLVNEKVETILDRDQQNQLQQIMLFYLHLRILIMHHDDKDGRDLWYRRAIDYIFQTETDLDSVKQRLYKLATDNLEDFFVQGRQILEVLDRLYE